MCCGKPSKGIARSRGIRVFKSKNKALFQIKKLKTFLMCRPSHYQVSYSINPWMDLARQVNSSKAVEQWSNLRERLEEHGGAIRFLKDQESLPDLVFTANGALLCKNNKVIIANFKYEERKKEEEWFVQWFAEEKYQFYYPSIPFEGAGDALYFRDESGLETLICGYGFRSDEHICKEISGMIGNYISVQLVDPYFYHLDTCFCPLSNSYYLIYPSAFSTTGLESIRALKGKEIIVPEEEAKLFACNSVCLGDKVIMPSGCPTTMRLLEKAGYIPVPVDMSEFIKAGGACKCLTLEIA